MKFVAPSSKTEAENLQLIRSFLFCSVDALLLSFSSFGSTQSFRKKNMCKLERMLLCGVLCVLCVPFANATAKNPIHCSTDPNCVLVGSVLARNNPTTAIFPAQVCPAIDIAVDKINTEILAEWNMTMQVVHHLYGSSTGQCNGDDVGGVVSDLYHSHHIQALIGPACSSAMSHAARMATYWNIPVVTGMAASRNFVVKKPSYTTLSRFGYCQCQLRGVFSAILELYGWRHVAVFVEESDSFAATVGDSIDKGLREPSLGGAEPYRVYRVNYNREMQHSYTEMLRLASENARIFIFSVNGDELRKFLLEAHSINMTDGEYAFLDIELFKVPAGVAWGDKSWERGDGQDTAAKFAYSALLRVSLEEPKSNDYGSFIEHIKQRALDSYSYSWPSNQGVNYFVGSFHDATMALGKAFAEQLRRNGSIEDGLGITSLMKDTWNDGVTGTFFVDDANDRLAYYNLMDMDPNDGQFKIVGSYAITTGYEASSKASVHWPNGKPPLDIPKCGFRNENKECWKKPEGVALTVVIVLAIIPVIGIGGLITYAVYRKLKYEQDLKNLSWRVSWIDITFYSVGNMGSRAARRWSFATSDTNDRGNISATVPLNQMDGQNSSNLTFGHYAGNIVAVKMFRSLRMDWKSRKFLEQMKTVSGLIHPNVVPFIGACVDVPNIAVLSECCSRGALSNLLHDTEMELDSILKLSILTDIAKGLKYLHSSGLPYHGQLNPENCLVDSRFVVKVYNWRMNGFESFALNKTELLYVAPEVLRNPQDLSKNADVYSFGMMVIEVQERAEPYDEERSFMDINEIIEKRINYDESGNPITPKSLNNLAENLGNLCKSCLSENPEERPNAAKTLKMLNSGQKKKDVNIMDSLIQRMEQYSKNLEDIVKERTDKLESQKQKMEELLCQMLPQSVAKQLLAGTTVQPESFECVTVYFGDLVGFTVLSSESTPLQIVTLLNDVYSCLDQILAGYRAYKVETIGDAYMVVSGLPERNENEHARQMALWSLSVVDSLRSFKIQHKPESKLRVRIGLNSGPVVAGVVGLKMPRYCLFGDTVNTASRMETHSSAEKIHVSDSTFSLLSSLGGFALEARDAMEIKGKGMMQTYWLVGQTEEPASSFQSHSSIDVGCIEEL